MGWLGELGKKLRSQTVNEVGFRKEPSIPTTPLGTLTYESDPRYGEVIQGRVRGEKGWKYSLTDEISVEGEVNDFGQAEVFVKTGEETKLLAKLPRIVVGTPTGHLGPQILGDALLYTEQFRFGVS